MTVGMVPQWKGLEVTARGYRSYPCAACFRTLACLSLTSHAARWGLLHFTTEQTASQSLKVTHPQAGTPRPEPRGEGCSGSGQEKGKWLEQKDEENSCENSQVVLKEGQMGMCPEQASPRSAATPGTKRTVGDPSHLVRPVG